MYISKINIKTKKKPVRTPVKQLHKKPSARRHKAKASIKRARPLHHRVFLHPFTVFILLCTGVFIANWTFRAAADSYQVTAKVAAAPLAQGATITQPTDGATITTNPVKVFGTCPANSYVVLFKNATMSGTALCSAGNTYEIETSLFPNANVLKIQDYNFTDDPGPATPDITVQYNPSVKFPPAPTPSPTPSVITPSTPKQPRAVVQPNNLPFITSDFVYKSFSTNAFFE